LIVGLRQFLFALECVNIVIINIYISWHSGTCRGWPYTISSRYNRNESATN